MGRTGSENIAHLGDVLRGPASDNGRVVIELVIERQEPLSGRAFLEGEADRPFEGWLQLLAILSRLIGEPDP